MVDPGNEQGEAIAGFNAPIWMAEVAAGDPPNAKPKELSTEVQVPFLSPPTC